MEECRAWFCLSPYRRFEKFKSKHIFLIKKIKNNNNNSYNKNVKVLYKYMTETSALTHYQLLSTITYNYYIPN